VVNLLYCTPLLTHCFHSASDATCSNMGRETDGLLVASSRHRVQLGSQCSLGQMDGFKCQNVIILGHDARARNQDLTCEMLILDGQVCRCSPVGHVSRIKARTPPNSFCLFLLSCLPYNLSNNPPSSTPSRKCHPTAARARNAQSL
jgi:hypothetical protein